MTDSSKLESYIDYLDRLYLLLDIDQEADEERSRILAMKEEIRQTIERLDELRNLLHAGTVGCSGSTTGILFETHEEACRAMDLLVELVGEKQNEQQ